MENKHNIFSTHLCLLLLFFCLISHKHTKKFFNSETTTIFLIAYDSIRWYTRNNSFETPLGRLFCVQLTYTKEKEFSYYDLVLPSLEYTNFNNRLLSSKRKNLFVDFWYIVLQHKQQSKVMKWKNFPL